MVIAFAFDHGNDDTPILQSFPMHVDWICSNKGNINMVVILAAFRVTLRPGVPPEEAGAAVAVESFTGTWTTVWTDGLTSLDRYKGRCYEIEPVAGEENQYIAYVAYPLS
ncbi:hypothetical protein POM88_034433 [Heracleum sosnowskyi]|uniref:Ribulose bisphosphate carboxylase large chain n=1 Tax=Heracleum sosnowskyi TaxID=360622 RepID=A0AAD8MC80_9APIA|nr:hypothetical protein POM88_034433 [Heracleum sosnowskyi]